MPAYPLSAFSCLAVTLRQLPPAEWAVVDFLMAFINRLKQGGEQTSINGGLSAL